ncbi:MAG: carbamoyl-phosphate synthase (glutamine-hydrolyzing) large subunit [Flavobacteriales bacterium]|jgi:carbamoyl-phosphate synthase large subunit|uniref:carbamoyl-phosphate synthase (glutamine-hydrolyzing) large subunit n=1 Tax=Blattabacterium sp. (Mastotermes darwiniensis) TaxID=39768 RepID=UPI000231DE2B|nr:carbamoyl-phosphate synthase (glutamine-hydrolyzing) large subunit [Blattabacterium sp. (Mastotermes darwiniensis)]AER40607.1 carbamoyl-phosphate synthase large subunit [Blattabacterium sp. (Mastotermes darwiniensis) str. MADAR]MDR1805104.1 carbamoyl-phosphate synthase (glutamine-hydrolyzing) large subunit [Flavobacteriales bacterium]
MKMDKVLILGSGALKIGEAGEFDYSGTQALKALKEEKIYTILINPNIATVQTSKEVADKVYFLPLTYFFIKSVIEKEKPKGILLSFGGQTALNCGIQLFKEGIIEKYKIKVLGTSIESIIHSEDRYLFRNRLTGINIKTAKSFVVHSMDHAISYSLKIGFPIIIRSSYTLGGLGSGFAKNIHELKKIVSKAFSYSSKVVVEEYLEGWKEIEYEIVRDKYNNCIAVCNMENLDPIGIHTGESIVVAPSQTLTNSEYYSLRKLAFHIARNFDIIGECNVQFALDPRSEDYRVIEVNARLSRSSALASKATGYPLAFISAKLAIGYGLHELKNSVNNTYAFFEPALDYVVCKIPRWDLNKFYGVSNKIGSSMKSVGEVMAIGKSFEEALQKGIRMLDIGMLGFINPKKKMGSTRSIKEYLKKPTDQRVLFIEEAFEEGISIREIHNLTKIDPWFLYQLDNIFQTKKEISSYENWINIPDELFRKAKKEGFSDMQIASIFIDKDGSNNGIDDMEEKIRKYRKEKGIIPYVRQIDTLASEYPSTYLYLTYHAIQHDILYEEDEKSVIVLGSGVYKIGSSVEFDWCCVNTLNVLKKESYRSIMINYNPETVSTDFDVCDRLYFEELTLERILDIIDLEKPKGTIVSMGGQIPNNLVLKLYEKKVNILGTSPIAIDEVENRNKFSNAMDFLGIGQPRWKELSDWDSIYKFVEEVDYPILVRPSYVLSGSDMNVISNSEELHHYLRGKDFIDSKLVITEFIKNAKEIELDAVSQNGEILYYAISEHVEFAGVHSGDATLVYPPHNLYLSTLKEIIRISKKIAKYFDISGPFNIQFLSKDNKLKVIECNLRASRSFPFVSKVSHFNMIELATQVLLGKKKKKTEPNFFTTNFLGIKASQFSFSSLQDSDPILGVDMTSTGEVGCLGYTFDEALLKSMLSVGYTIPKKNILISVGPIGSKLDLLDMIKLLHKKKYILFATEGTNSFLSDYGIPSIRVHWPNVNVRKSSNVLDLIKDRKFDLIINIPKNISKSELDNDYAIRRYSVDFNIPLLTNARLAKAFIQAFCNKSMDQLFITSWDEYR